MTRVPLIVCAKNEAAALGACLDSLLAACAFAEARRPIALDVRVVLDDTIDGSEAIARARGVTVLRSTGGKVEAQRRGLAEARAPFAIFSDADVAVDAETIDALCALMLDDPTVEVAHPPKQPVAPARSTRLARALHVYNLHRGFSARRTWFSGKLFAIRAWSVPTPRELRARLDALDPFLRADGLRADDVYLSRAIVATHGPDAIRETARGRVWFRAPETFRGMYRYYRRLRQELERVDRLFPEWNEAARRFGARSTDEELLARATAEERRAFAVFRAALVACRALYACDRAYHRFIARAPGESWKPIEETKRPIS